MSYTFKPNRRILLVDDEEAIHNSIRKLLTAHSGASNLNRAEVELFGVEEELASAITHLAFEIDSAFQGQDAVAMVEKAKEEGRPYAMAYVDIRMPPGWDGIETIKRIWQIAPDIQVVICSAHSDYTWQRIIEHLGYSHQLLVLKKPFEHIEIAQSACALTEKWNLTREVNQRSSSLENLVNERTSELNDAVEQLQKTNGKLQYEVCERRKAERQLWHSAFHDELTGLPNRSLLNERLERCMLRRKRDRDYRYAVLFVDLDNFKVINDSRGHRIGDELLAEVAKRLHTGVRSLDTMSRPCSDTTARLGGDEFVILLDGMAKTSDVSVVAQRVLEALIKPIEIDDELMHVSASIGYTTDAEDYDSPEDVLRDADTALYAAKSNGKGMACEFIPEMRAQVMTRMQLGQDLRTAIDQRQLFLQYQPLISLKTGCISGFEALARWNHPIRGMILPCDFIPLAEETGDILALGKWVIEEATHQIKTWQRRYSCAANLGVSVNVSVAQIKNAELQQSITDILRENQLDSGQLVVEITESIMAQLNKDIDSFRKTLHDMGIRLHLDDFGTGYSSMQYIEKMKPDAIKIARTFLKKVAETGQARSTIESIVSLARKHDMETIAEGVEVIEQLDVLQQCGCNYAQGYFFYQPLDVEGVEEILASGGLQLISPIHEFV